MVYASEGLRGTLVPQFPHLSLLAVLSGLALFDLLLLVMGSDSSIEKRSIEYS